jgi:hypothetical protein
MTTETIREIAQSIGLAKYALSQAAITQPEQHGARIGVLTAMSNESIKSMVSLTIC